MKYDCNRTLDFSHELKRMCYSYIECESCQFGGDCPKSGEISQKKIDIVQKWSDEHPEETMCEHFMKLFPKAPYTINKIPVTCPKFLGWIDDETCDESHCVECWNKPYEKNISK